MLKREEMLCFSLGVAMRRISKINAERLEQGMPSLHRSCFCRSRLQANDGQKPCDLAEQVCLDASSLTGLLDRTEKVGLIQRRPDPEDRRAVHLSHSKRTKASAGLSDVVSEVQCRIEREFFAEYTDETAKCFGRCWPGYGR